MLAPFRKARAAVLAARVGLVVVGLVVGVADSRAFAAPPDVKFLFPAGAARGATVEVTANGSLKPWPCRVWVSGEGVRFEPAKAEGKFNVVVDAGAAVGRRWVRFYSAEGASVLKPFVVGDGLEINEVETNDEAGHKIDFVGPPIVVNGALAKAGDVDAFLLTLKQGQVITAVVEAHSVLGSPVDAVLQVADEAGIVRMQNHDDRGLDPGLTYTAPADGAYLLRVFGFASEPNSSVRYSGAPDNVYRLTITAGPMQVPPPAETETRLVVPSDVKPASIAPATAEAPQKITPPAAVRGLFAKPGERHVYSLETVKGTDYRIRVASHAIGGSADPMLKILSRDGTLIKRGDDIGRNDFDVDITWKAPAATTYQMVVEETFGSAGPRHHYLLDVRPVESDFGLTVAADVFTVEKGKPLEIPVTVVRTAGMTGEIDVRLEGLPADFGKIAAVSETKGDSSKKVTLKFTPAKSFTGRVQVVGELRNQSKTKRAATFNLVAPAGTKTDDLWLTVTGK
jgi:hypothetical protein